MGAVVTVTGKPIQLPHQHSVEQSLCAVLHHLLKFRAVVCFGRQRPVNVTAQNRNPVFIGVFFAFPKLPFDAFLPLIVAAVSGVNHRLHPHHLRLSVLRGLGSPKVRLVDIQTLCLRNQSPAGKPFSQHHTLPQLLPESYHQPIQIPASNLSKKYRLGKKNSPSPAGTFNCAAPFLHAILSASVCLVRFQKTPASGEAMCGQGFPPLTVVLILPYFLKLLDCRTPLLFRNTLFLSQLVRDLGWEASACHPL